MVDERKECGMSGEDGKEKGKRKGETWEGGYECFWMPGLGGRP